METLKAHNAAKAILALPAADDPDLGRAGVACDDCSTSTVLVELVFYKKKPILKGPPKRREVHCLACKLRTFQLL